MTIFVDALERWGWKMRGRFVESCHMFTDSPDLEELHAFAERIGMRRSWFQDHRVAPHYDLTSSRRAAAVLLGAVEVGRQEASAIWKARREVVQRYALGPVSVRSDAPPAEPNAAAAAAEEHERTSLF